MTQFTINTLSSIAILFFATGFFCGAVVANLRTGVQTSRMQRKREEQEMLIIQHLNERLAQENESKRLDNILKRHKVQTTAHLQNQVSSELGDKKHQ